MSIKLISLKIHQFKGVMDFEMLPDGECMTVSGANGTGKSTLANAFLWLLTGKDAVGRDNYEIFPLAENGTRMSGCTPTVTACIEVEGVPATITRQLSEKFSKRAGAVSAVYAGDETKCTIDDVPTAITKYNAWVDEMICPAELLPLLLNASYFSEQTKDYRQRRELLLKQFGGIDEAVILASSAELAPLREAIGRHSVEEMRQILTTQRKAHNDTLKAIPARIDELRRQVGDDLPDPEALRHQRGRLEVEIAKLRREQTNLSAVQVAADAKREQAQIQQDIALAETRRKTLMAAINRDAVEAHGKASANADARRQAEAATMRKIEMELTEVSYSAEAVEKEVNKLRREWVARNGETADVSDTCPFCGQPLPADQVQSAVAAWNLQKSKDLDGIMSKAGTLKDKLSDLRAREKDLSERLSFSKQAYATANTEFAKIAAERPADDQSNPIFSEIDAEIDDLRRKLARAVLKVGDAEKAAEQASAEISTKLANLQDASDTISQDIARFELAQVTSKRINDLEAEQHDTLAALEKTEMLLAQCSEYTRVMVEMLTDQVNQRFRTVAFRLFETQKNGGLREICEAAVDGVPYGSLNTASKMQANVEIVEAFARASGHRMPLFLDNRESVTTVDADPETQIINLQVVEAAPLTCTKI